MGQRRLSQRWLAVLVLLACGLRVAAALALWQRPIVDDERAYDEIGRRLVAGHGFSTERALGLVNPGGGAPTSVWGCLQPLYVAAVYRIAGPVPGAVYLVNALVGLTPVWFAAWLAGRLGGRGAAIAAGLCIAVDPYLVKFSASLMTETLYVALLCVALRALIGCSAEAPGLAHPAVAGAILGLASLSRGQGFYFAVAGLVWVALERRRTRRGLLREAAAYASLLALVIAPWVMRNRAVHDPPVFLDTKAGWNLYAYLHPDFVPLEGTHVMVPPEVLDETVSESRRDAILKRAALDFIRRDPGRILAMVPAKQWLLWSPLPGPLTAPSLAPIKLAFVLPLELLALAGLVAIGVGRREVRLVLLLLLFHVAVHSLMTGGPRFRVPLDPALAALAGSAVAGLTRCLRRRRRSAGTPAGT